MKKYKLVNGTSYHEQTNDEIINVLEKVRNNKTRIIIDYGDVDTGKSWGEINDVSGYVGRSTGEIKVPLLVYNTRSLGGPAMLDHCIIAIHTSKGKKPLYLHPTLKNN